MKRLWYVWLALAAVVPVYGTDQTISSTKIYTDPTGATFYVDGTKYNAPVTFSWAQGTTHTLILKESSSLSEGAQYTCSTWADSKGLVQTSSATLEIVSDPSITSYVGSCKLQYRLQLGLIERTGEGLTASCATVARAPGLVYVNGTCTDHSAEFWFDADATVQLQAVPYVNAEDSTELGYVFVGWSVSDGTTDSSYLTTITMDQPLQIPVMFQLGKKVYLATDPAGLKVLVDREEVTTPYAVNWAAGSQHSLGANTPQLDANGNPLVFDSWSNGGGQNTTYTTETGETVSYTTLTASFVEATYISLLTSPSGLKLTVDGSSAYTDYNFAWAVGSTHQVTPVQEQVSSSDNRKYSFVKWEDDATTTRTIEVKAGVVPEGQLTAVGYTYTADYELMGRVIVQTSPSGLTVTVDGSTCTTPCTVDKLSGSTLTVIAPSTADWVTGGRWMFGSWSDGGSLAHTITFTSDIQTVTATYVASYLLTTASNPTGGATFVLSPTSTDNYYVDGTAVTVKAVAGNGYKFRRWDGALSGTISTGTVTMSAPHTVTAILQTVPYVAPAGIRNAAAVTPDEVVAAGSIIAIIGTNLSTNTVSATSKSPLPQTLDNVVVRVGSQYLPLFSVSPTLITATLPSVLAAGSYTLTVTRTGYTDVTGTFIVERNAPGLFINSIDDRALVLANHEDGTAITFDSPAKQGEKISVFGTGFGPYTRSILDGFAVSKTAVIPLVDAVTVVAGDVEITPDWSGAAVSEVGKCATKFTITNSLPTASTVELKVKINGRESNTVLLPLE